MSMVHDRQLAALALLDEHVGRMEHACLVASGPEGTGAVWVAPIKDLLDAAHGVLFEFAGEL